MQCCAPWAPATWTCRCAHSSAAGCHTKLHTTSGDSKRAAHPSAAELFGGPCAKALCTTP